MSKQESLKLFVLSDRFVIYLQRTREEIIEVDDACFYRFSACCRGGLRAENVNQKRRNDLKGLDSLEETKLEMFLEAPNVKDILIMRVIFFCYPF